MNIELVTGGARSGKSHYAENRAAHLAAASPVTFIATAEALDDEMRTRIANHRISRPAHWQTIERTHNIAEAIRDSNEIVILDCLTLLVSNVFLHDVDNGELPARAAVLREVDALLEATRVGTGALIVVTNEVGCGVVPPTELGRWFRDCLGEANARVAERAARVTLLVAGCPLNIKGES